MREVPQRLASPSEETPKKKKKNQISVSSLYPTQSLTAQHWHCSQLRLVVYSILGQFCM